MSVNTRVAAGRLAAREARTDAGCQLAVRGIPAGQDQRTRLGRRGVVLVIVLIVVAGLSLAAYSFTSLMLVQSEATQIAGCRAQANLLAASGVESLRAFLLQDAATRADAGGTYDNPGSFQARMVLDDGEPGGQGKFTVVSPALDTEGMAAGVRYGLEDESARINLNALLLIEEQALQMAGGQGGGSGGGRGDSESQGEDASGGGESRGDGAEPAEPDEEDVSFSGRSSARVTASEDSSSSAAGGGSASGGGSAAALAAVGLEDELDDALGTDGLARNLLLGLPGMNVEIADAILDWLDEDDEPREFGAEFEYYSALDPPYAPKNGPLETVEELLLVRGVTPQLLFGYDVNRNGMVDVDELAMSGAISDLPERGLSAYFTLHSKEQNVNALGEPRIDLNSDDLQQLFDELSLVFPEEWVTYIIAYRQSGPYSGEEDGEYASGELDLTQPGKTKLTQVLDLIGKKVEIKFQGAEEATVLLSPFAEDLVSMGTYMPQLMDEVTIVGDSVIPGRISLSQAPREVLLGIPGMTDEIVEQILGQRVPEPAVDDPTQQHETWLLTDGIVTLEEMRTLMPLVCAAGHVYRAQVVGFYDDGRASSRLEVILDATQLPPRLLLWRDISHLGRGYALETLGVELSEGM